MQKTDGGFVVHNKCYDYFNWIDNDSLKGCSESPLFIFCNKIGDKASMNFVKAYKNEGKFYCDSSEFSEKVKSGEVVVMKNDKGNVLRVVPGGFHNYENLFSINDLIAAEVCLPEIFICQNKYKGE